MNRFNAQYVSPHAHRTKVLGCFFVKCQLSSFVDITSQTFMPRTPSDAMRYKPNE